MSSRPNWKSMSRFVDGHHVGGQERHVHQLDGQIVGGIGGHVQQRIGERPLEQIAERRHLEVDVVDHVQRAQEIHLAPVHELLAHLDVEGVEPERHVRLPDQVVDGACRQRAGGHRKPLVVVLQVRHHFQERRPEAGLVVRMELAQGGQPHPFVGVERLLRHPAVVVEPHEPAHRDLLGEQDRERRQSPDQQRRDACAGKPHRRLPLPQVALGKEPVRNLARERQFLEHDLRHVAGLMVEHPHP